MVRTGTAPAAAAPSTSKYAKAPKATKPKTAPTHPPVASLVTTAISALNEKGGSSLSAIKKHISANNNVDVKRLAPFIRRFLVSAVGKGTLIQVKGKGASGSFKLNKAVKKETKPKVIKKPKSDKPKKAAGEKEVKQVIAPKEPKEVKPKAAEPVKAPVEKPEATKPAKSVKKAVPKKAAPKKAPAKK